MRQFTQIPGCIISLNVRTELLLFPVYGPERACQAYAVETLGQAPQGSGCERCTKLPTVLSSSSEESMQSQHVQTEPTRSIFFCGETAIPKGRLQAMDDPGEPIPRNVSNLLHLHGVDRLLYTG